MQYDIGPVLETGVRDIISAWLLVAALLSGLVVFPVFCSFVFDDPAAVTADFAQSALNPDRAPDQLATERRTGDLVR